MNQKTIERFKESKVKIFLKGGDLYTGYFETFDETSILLRDKFGSLVNISLDSINLIKEV